MSFSLLTAINFEDIPRILRTCANCYRGNNTTRYPTIWKIVANEFVWFADHLTKIIEEAKKTEPKAVRERIKL